MLTRPFLKSLGIESEKIDAIIEGHTDTVNGLKSEKEALQAQVEALKPVEKERNDLQAKLDKADKQINSLQEKANGYDAIVKERDELSGKVQTLQADIDQFTQERETANTELTSLREKVSTFETEKTTLTQERDAVKGEFEAFKTQVQTEKTNTAKRDAVRTALRNGGVERSDFQDLIINSMNLDDVNMTDDGIENADTFIESTRTKYPSCFGTVQEGGTPPITPPSGGGKTLTRAQIEKMTPDEINANWDAVQQALAKG